MTIIIYTMMIVPSIFLALEASIRVISSFSTDIQEKGDVIFRIDAISGWRSCQSGQVKNISLSGSQCNRHGLAITPYQSRLNDNNIGLLLTGNSVAKGTNISSKKNRQNFPGMLESKLRQTNQLIDIVNLSDNGFNSWQEHIEIARYLNASPIYDDLPDIKLIISFGGIQDFWTFFELIKKGDLHNGQYMKANNLMIDLQTLDFVDNIQKAKNGNIILSVDFFLQSIVAFLRDKSKLFQFSHVSLVKFSDLLMNRDHQLNSHELNINTFNDSYPFLDDLVTDMFNLDMTTYNSIKEYVTDSVVRNIRASSAISNAKYIFAYAPTFYSAMNVEYQNNVPIIPPNIMTNKYLYDLGVREIEKDYRQTLLRKLRSVKDVMILDYSPVATSTNWFIDYAHFSNIGTENMSNILANDLLKILNNMRK